MEYLIINPHINSENALIKQRAMEKEARRATAIVIDIGSTHAKV